MTAFLQAAVKDVFVDEVRKREEDTHCRDCFLRESRPGTEDEVDRAF